MKLKRGGRQRRDSGKEGGRWRGVEGELGRRGRVGGAELGWGCGGRRVVDVTV